MFLYLPSLARIRSFQGAPYYPFLRHSRLIYIPVSFWLVLSIRSPASRAFAAQSLLCSFVLVPATVLGDPRREVTSSRRRHYGERKRLLRRSRRQRATTAASSRKSFIKFLITEIIVIEIELGRMMFAWTGSESGKQRWGETENDRRSDGKKMKSSIIPFNVCVLVFDVGRGPFEPSSQT